MKQGIRAKGSGKRNFDKTGFKSKFSYYLIVCYFDWYLPDIKDFNKVNSV